MLPHPQGEEESISQALFNIDLALYDFQPPKDFGAEETRMLFELRLLVSTDHLVDPDGEGLHFVRASAMTVDERHRLSNLVDELASVFSRYDHS